MDIRIIAMDLDGTALQRDRCSFSPRLIQALEDAHKLGVEIVPVTGRQFDLLPPAVKNHPSWENLAILCNGGQIRRLSDGKLLDGLTISEAALKNLLDISRRFDLPIEFSVDSRLHLTEHDFEKQLPFPELAFHRDSILANFGVTVEAMEPLCREKVEKVNLLCIPEILKEEVETAMADIEVSAVWSSASAMEITHPDATKGRGITRLCEILGRDPGQVMALGDSGNDISMLHQAGLGVAMGNAPEFVKRHADVVTLTNEEDGAAIAIERYVLGR